MMILVKEPAYKSTEKKMMPRVAETVTPPSYVKSDKKPQALSDATMYVSFYISENEYANILSVADIKRIVIIKNWKLQSIAI